MGRKLQLAARIGRSISASPKQIDRKNAGPQKIDLESHQANIGDDIGRMKDTAIS
jgi:hypothetical protein